jgi:hypothetical protein
MTSDSEHRKKVFDRLLKSSSSHYLTLVSVVQGVVLGYGLFVIEANKDKFLLSNWLLVITTFIFILCVWDEYQAGAAVYEWIPGFRDSLIPFLIGVTEILLVQSLNSFKKWFIFAAILSFLGIIAFYNMYSSAAKIQKNIEVLTLVKGWKKATYIFCILSTIIFLVFWFKVSHDNSVIFVILSLIIALLFLCLGRVTRRRIIKYALKQI